MMVDGSDGDGGGRPCGAIQLSEGIRPRSDVDLVAGIEDEQALPDAAPADTVRCRSDGISPRRRLSGSREHDAARLLVGPVQERFPVNISEIAAQEEAVACGEPAIGPVRVDDVTTGSVPIAICRDRVAAGGQPAGEAHLDGDGKGDSADLAIHPNSRGMGRRQWLLGI